MRSPQPRRTRPLRRPDLESLEPRVALSTAATTALDQQLLERINDARADLGSDRPNDPTSRPLALAPEVKLVARQAAEGGARPADRTKVALRKVVRIREGNSIVYVRRGASDDPDAIDTLAQDIAMTLRKYGRSNRGYAQHTAIGVDVTREEPFGPENPILWARVISFRPRDNRAMVSGVVMRDANGDGLYDPGEGLAGVKISVPGRGTTMTSETGGYTLRLRGRGRVEGIASGGELEAPATWETVIRPGRVSRLNIVLD